MMKTCLMSVDLPESDTNKRRLTCTIVALLLIFLLSGAIRTTLEARETALVQSNDRLIQQGLALLQPVTATIDQFEIVIRADVIPPAAVLEPRVEEGAASQARRIELSVARTGSESWRLYLLSPWRNAAILHCATQTQLVVPRENVVFTGSGPLESRDDSLAPNGFLTRLITSETAVFPFLSILAPATIEGGLRTFVLPQLAPVSVVSEPLVASATFGVSLSSQVQPAAGTTASGDVATPPDPTKPVPPLAATDLLLWKTTRGITVATRATGPAWIRVEVPKGVRGLDDFRFIELRRGDRPAPLPDLFHLPVSAQMAVPRGELEKLVFRGLKRILSLKLPGPDLLAPLEPRTVKNGELARVGDQLIVLLWGTPEQIGEAHAQLLGPLYRRTVDSTVYLVGLVETIAKGRWFLNDLQDAWKRVSPYIPDDHKTEMAAMARAYPGVTAQEVELSNVFPEYFHCSGFAVFGSASQDGVLYHGRVLDYMTEIGLQQSAVNFVVKPRGKRAFLNVGFAGFIGSVSGMNDAQIALGEMGGRGRFEWDGAPMATLMRRALEECDTLGQVKEMWASGPRTCEYYYVFSDGKIPDAVAVKATPKELEFLAPGETHPLLGEGFKDAVVLSAGSRLKHLRERVQAGLGTFTASSAIELMSRPVAMKSNLHNVLFVPQKLEAWVAVAGDGQPAAERTYERIDFPEWLKRIPGP
jgi:hypothetical protein